MQLGREEELWLAGYGLVARLCAEGGEAEDAESSVEARVGKVKGFFTQLYARDPKPGPHTWPREEWEYLAHRVYSSVEPYRDIAQHITSASRYPPGHDLTQDYRNLADDRALQTLRSALESCCSVEDD